MFSSLTIIIKINTEKLQVIFLYLLLIIRPHRMHEMRTTAIDDSVAWAFVSHERFFFGRLSVEFRFCFIKSITDNRINRLWQINVLNYSFIPSVFYTLGQKIK